MKIIKKIALTLTVNALLLCSALSLAADVPEHFRSDVILSEMKKVNNYALENPWRPYDRDWIRATMYTGVMEAYHATGDDSYLKQAQKWAQKHHFSLGHERSGFNRMFISMTSLELHLLDNDPKKIANIIKQLKEEKEYKPEIGKIWYGHEPHANDAGWVYADSLYAAPAFAMLTKATGDQHYLDLLNDAFWKATSIIYDKDEDLYYRDPTYIGKRTSAGGKILWARGNGWVFAGLPRLLKYLDKTDPNYQRYLDLYKAMAKSIASRQGDDGFWRANLGDDTHYKMPESSSTAFFTAGFAWGINQGILDKETYLSSVIRGWDALNRSIHPDGFMGWVQPVDAEPRPSHPKSTQEYAVGLFLYAGAHVYQLVEKDIITESTVAAALLKDNPLLPPAAFTESLTAKQHPANHQIKRFLAEQNKSPVKPTGLEKNDYLEVIANQVTAMSQYQNKAGRIIDPVDNKEMYFTTPTYAHSIAVLAEAKYPIDSKLIESGMKALDVALQDMAQNTARDHSDFFTWPLVLAVESFETIASEQRKRKWQQQLAKIDPTKYHFYNAPIEPSDHRGFYKTYREKHSMNWNLVHSAGEWARSRHSEDNSWYVDYSMTMQLRNFTSHGMYNEGGNPLAYDLFSRHYLSAMLANGYDSFLHSTYRDILWRGAWTSLFMQSPFGEAPTGYRSTHHIWNEAQQAVVFEIYASAYAKEGMTKQAGVFKRAANLSLQSIKQWIRPDGSGYIVKNRYPIEHKHGYERYSKHSCYNMLATSMLAQAWKYANDSIKEVATPADVGGYVLTTINPHRKIFSNAAGNYVEYDVKGDLKYNPTGLIRVHLKDGHPQLGPSDGISKIFSGKDSNIAVGPSWKSADGNWTSLANYQGKKPRITLLAETADKTQFEVAYPQVTQRITVDKKGVTIEDSVTEASTEKMKVSFPALIFDGKERAGIELSGNTLDLSLNGDAVKFEVLEPAGVNLQRSNQELGHRNGLAEEIFAETDSKRIVYRISAK